MTTDDLRKAAFSLLAARRFQEALPKVLRALETWPGDWGLLHGLAIAVDATKGIEHAHPHFARALQASPNNPVTLTMFGLGLHREGQHIEAKHRFVEAATSNPDYHDAYVGLALAQRDLGEFDKAVHNLDAAGKAMARTMARFAGQHNSVSSPIYPYRRLGRDLWVEHAVFGAMHLVAEDGGLGEFRLPTHELAQVEYRERRFQGLYFRDIDENGKLSRLYLPNYLDSFREWLVGHASYISICEVMGQVLHALGRSEEGQDHQAEAEAFRSAKVAEPSISA